MATRHPVDQGLCPALNGITACLAEPLAAFDIAFHFFGRQPLEADNAVANSAPQPAIAVDNCNRAEDMMAAAA